MQKHQLSLNTLGQKIGSRADLRRILADDANEAKRSSVFERLKEAKVFSDEEITSLQAALEVSSVGISRYKCEQAVLHILTGKPYAAPEAIRLSGETTFRERLAFLESAEEIELLCFNSCFPSLIAALQPLFQSKSRHVSMKHYFHASAYEDSAASLVAVIFPLLFDHRYKPYILELAPEEDTYALGGNFVCIRAVFATCVRQFFFIMPDAKTALEMPNAAEVQIYEYLSSVLTALRPAPVCLKEQEMPHFDFTALCMTFLSHELNRATYSLSNDICFQQIPSDIVIAALEGKGLLPENILNDLIRRTYFIHEQRYQNLFQKKKPNYRIMTVAGCERFLETGCSTDHFVGFRPFTPAERQRIFGDMLKVARVNPHFIPLLLKDHQSSYRYNMECYDKLGVSLDVKDTDYDIEKGYQSVFLMYPEFTQQYMDYYLKTLVGEKCYTREESLQILQDIYECFLKKHELTNDY